MKVMESLCKSLDTHEHQVVVISELGNAKQAHDEINSQQARTLAVKWAQAQGLPNPKLDMRSTRVYLDDQYNEIEGTKSLSDLDRTAHVGTRFRLHLG